MVFLRFLKRKLGELMNSANALRPEIQIYVSIRVVNWLLLNIDPSNRMRDCRCPWRLHLSGFKSKNEMMVAMLCKMG